MKCLLYTLFFNSLSFNHVGQAYNGYIKINNALETLYLDFQKHHEKKGDTTEFHMFAKERDGVISVELSYRRSNWNSFLLIE